MMNNLYCVLNYVYGLVWALYGTVYVCMQVYVGLEQWLMNVYIVNDTICLYVTGRGRSWRGRDVLF